MRFRNGTWLFRFLPKIPTRDNPCFCANHVSFKQRFVSSWPNLSMCILQRSCQQDHGINDHRSQLIGSSLFCYNSPAAAAREVFKPSPDSASLVVSSQKKKFQFWVRGSLGGSSQVGVFCVFMAYFDRPWTPIEWAHIFDQIFLWN